MSRLVFTHSVQQWRCLSALKKANDDDIADVPALQIEDLRTIIGDLFSPVIKVEFSGADDAIVVG